MCLLTRPTLRSFQAAKQLLRLDIGHAQAIADEYRRTGSVTLEAATRELAEELSERLQGAGALVYLEPSDVTGGPLISSSTFAARDYSGSLVCVLILLVWLPIEWAFGFVGPT